MPLPDLLAELRDAKKRVPARRLAQLSVLAGPDLELFRGTWERLAVGQRRDLLQRLEDLAEDSPELIFDPIFLLALGDADKDIRLGAIEGLTDNRERGTLELLLRLLSQDPEEEVRAAAAQALGTFALMAALGELPPSRAEQLAGALLTTVRDAKETMEVRRRALESVAAIDSAEVKSLIRQAYYEGEEKEKASALHAMGRNLDPEWGPLLMEEMESANPEFRYEASTALGEMALEEAVEPLTRALDDEDFQVQLSAIQALGEIGGPEAKAALQGALQHEDERLSEAARDALAELALDQEPLLLVPPPEEER